MNQEKSIFLGVMGDYPLNRVLDFLIVHNDFDYAMKEIAVKSGVGYSTLKLFWRDLANSKMVELTRKIGRARLYRLNNKNPVVEQLEKLYWTITHRVTQDMLKEKVIA